MSDLISREKAINTVSTMYKVCGTNDIKDYRDLMAAALKDLPTAEKRGHWIKKWHTVFKEELPCCSECNNFMAFRWDYCPNCGARMDTFEGAMNPPEGE